MSKAKHTDGPWFIDNSTDYVNGHDLDAISVVQKNGEQWHVAAVWADLPDVKEASANARLIAEAPAMYDLLRQYAETIGVYTPQQKQFNSKVLELIKKIEG